MQKSNETFRLRFIVRLLVQSVLVIPALVIPFGSALSQPDDHIAPNSDEYGQTNISYSNPEIKGNKKAKKKEELIRSLFLGDFLELKKYLDHGGDPGVKFSIAGLTSVSWLDYVFYNISHSSDSSSYAHHSPDELSNEINFVAMGTYVDHVDFELIRELMDAYLNAFHGIEKLNRVISLVKYTDNLSHSNIQETLLHQLQQSCQSIDPNKCGKIVVDEMGQLVKNRYLRIAIMRWIHDFPTIFKVQLLNKYIALYLATPPRRETDQLFQTDFEDSMTFISAGEKEKENEIKRFLEKGVLAVIEKWKNNDADAMFFSLLHRSLFEQFKSTLNTPNYYYRLDHVGLDQLVADIEHYFHLYKNDSNTQVVNEQQKVAAEESIEEENEGNGNEIDESNAEEIDGVEHQKVVDQEDQVRELNLDITYVLSLLYTRCNSQVNGPPLYDVRKNFLSLLLTKHSKQTVFDSRYWAQFSLPYWYKQKIRQLFLTAAKNGFHSIDHENLIFRQESTRKLLTAGGHKSLIKFLDRRLVK